MIKKTIKGSLGFWVDMLSILCVWDLVRSQAIRGDWAKWNSTWTQRVSCARHSILSVLMISELEKSLMLILNELNERKYRSLPCARAVTLCSSSGSKVDPPWSFGCVCNCQSVLIIILSPSLLFPSVPSKSIYLSENGYIVRSPSFSFSISFCIMYYCICDR